MSKEISDYKSPPHKVIGLLKEGRDQLRVKYKLLLKNTGWLRIKFVPPATTKITTELVQEALSSCRMKHLIAWTRETLRSGVHVARREDLQASDEEIKLRSIIAPATPTF